MRLFILVILASYFLLGYATSLILGHILFGRCSLKLELLKLIQMKAHELFSFSFPSFSLSAPSLMLFIFNSRVTTCFKDLVAFKRNVWLNLLQACILIKGLIARSH